MNKDPNVELKNADVNFNQYGDDSSAPNQATAWGMNMKYTGEKTLNSNIPYNANIKTTDLDPEYKYGWDAQVANTNEAWYIARRNDNIASALYNEGRRSKEDVIQFLGSQKNWNNSTESDRFNTVESVWKRIWDIAEQNDKDNTEIEVKEMEAEKKEEPKWQDVNVNTFLQWTTTELFGKMITWADTAPYDHNSNEWKKAEARLAQYQKINALSVSQLASSIKAWSILSGWQAMRDLQTYNPEKYQQLQDYQKKEETMDTVNMISTGNYTSNWTTLNDKTWESVNNYLNETVANAGWDSLARMDLDTAISQNEGIVNYAERMSYYQGKINQLDQTIWDLEADARKRLSKTTWENVPEYMIQAYVNNRSKKLYKERNNLLNQYNYYKGVYEAQVEEEATKWDRAYKEKQLQLQYDKFAWDQKMDQANLDYKYDTLNYDYYNLNQKYWMDDTTVQSWLNNYITSIQDKITNHGKIRQGRCGEPVNDYLSSLWVNFRYDDKKSTKLNSVTKWAWPKVWSIAVWDKTGTTDGDKYWHVAIVTSVNNKNGTITVLESNKNTGLRYHTYKQANVYGYYDPTASSKKSSKSTETYTVEDWYKKLKNGTITYATYIKNSGDTDQDEKNRWIIQQAMSEVKTWKDMQNTFNWLRKISASNFFTGEQAQNTRYEMLNALSESNKSSKDIMKIVKAWNDELGDDDDKLWDRLSIALAWRYTSVDQLDKDLDVIWYKDKWYTTNKAKKIWNIWKEDGII